MIILLFHHKDKKKYATAQGFFKQIYCNYVRSSAIAVQTQYKSGMVERGWPPILADHSSLIFRPANHLSKKSEYK